MFTGESNGCVSISKLRFVMCAGESNGCVSITNEEETKTSSFPINCQSNGPQSSDNTCMRHFLWHYGWLPDVVLNKHVALTGFETRNKILILTDTLTI